MSEISLRKLSYVFIEFCHFNYSKDKLILKLMKKNFDLDIQDVQSNWNGLEPKLANFSDIDFFEFEFESFIKVLLILQGKC